MATPNYLTGNVVGITVDATTMYAKSGEVTTSATEINCTNSESNGFQELKSGIKSARGSAVCVYNGDDPPSLTEGTEATVIWTATGGELITMLCLLNNIRRSFTVDADYEYAFDFASTTAYTVA